MTRRIADRSKQRGVKRDWESRVARVIAGDFIQHSAGYRLLYCPMHPTASCGYVKEHRVVAETKCGRSLAPGEMVHHRNGDKTDNRPENLEVMTAAAHTRLHLTRIPDAEVIAMIEEGAIYPQLAAMGVATKRIRRLRKEIGIPFRQRNDLRVTA